MAKLNQNQVYEQLKKTYDPIEKRDLALQLVQVSLSRQVLDTALRILESETVQPTLNDEHRPILREKTHYYFEHDNKDKAGMLREKLIRLLVHIGHPDDKDLYLLGVATYEPQPVTDVAQNLRAVALAGLATVEPQLAVYYATKLIGEDDTSVFNCEPAMTAVAVLVQEKQFLPIYQFLLLRGYNFLPQAKSEVVGKAFESLGADFPVNLYQELAKEFVALDIPVVSMGIVTYIIENRIQKLYTLLKTIITSTTHDELHRFALLTLAAARDEQLRELLYGLAKHSSMQQLPNFIEAVEVTFHEGRDDLLFMLQNRLTT